MSFPWNSHEASSINAGIEASNFLMAWGTFDSTSELILSLPDSCTAATFDISAAYRITLIQPAQQNALCIHWRDNVYVDRAVMFSLSSSAGVFGAVADMLVAIYEKAGFGPICKWVDDFFIVQLPGQAWTESDFTSLTAEIGVPWSHGKTRMQSTTQRYIGFDWDLAQKTVALPPEKLKAVL
jgi:hypothetical protein